MAEPTYILVHGAWHGAWCWRELGRELDERGVSWRALDLPSSRPDADPSTGLKGDAAALCDFIVPNESVVLVGHSYGGSVITEAAASIENLERLIYIAGFVPRKGQSTAGASKENQIRTRLDDAIIPDGEMLRLDPKKAIEALFHQSPKELASWAVGQLTPQTVRSFRDQREADSSSVSTAYILCTSDRAVDPDVQAVMASRCDENLTLKSDHSPFFSHPSLLANALLA